MRCDRGQSPNIDFRIASQVSEAQTRAFSRVRDVSGAPAALLVVIICMFVGAKRGFRSPAGGWSTHPI